MLYTIVYTWIHDLVVVRVFIKLLYLSGSCTSIVPPPKKKKKIPSIQSYYWCLIRVYAAVISIIGLYIILLRYMFCIFHTHTHTHTHTHIPINYFIFRFTLFLKYFKSVKLQQVTLCFCVSQLPLYRTNTIRAHTHTFRAPI